MLIFALKRLFQTIPTLLVVFTLTFFVMRWIPGGPFDSEKALPPEIKANIDHRFGLDKPVWQQYFHYLGAAVQGDFGPSYRSLGERGVSETIAESLPVSLKLGAIALAFALLVGIPLGLLSAYKQGGFFDFSVMFIAVSGLSLPSFLTGAILILLFSIWLDWFPPALWEGPSSVVLPALTLGLRPMALIARLLNTSIQETLQTDYIRTAYAKGLAPSIVVFKHAFRNSLIPLVTILGPLTAAVITGSFVVEMMFAIPGLGRYFVSSVIDRDYPMIMGVTIVYGVIIVTANLVVDLLYFAIDPRIDSGGR